MAKRRLVIKNVDDYLLDGCGRCPFVGTPQCKVNLWRNELKALRRIVLACGLTEMVKWSMPCYTVDGKNILAIAAFRHYAALSFFKGALLRDESGILTSHGENSQSFRTIRFTDTKSIGNLEPIIRTYILEAVELEKQGLKVRYKNIEEYDMPKELLMKLSEDSTLKMAFDSLTPGRKRGYILFISGAKQTSTRIARIEKCIPKILVGKGLQDQ